MHLTEPPNKDSLRYGHSMVDLSVKNKFKACKNIHCHFNRLGISKRNISTKDKTNKFVPNLFFSQSFNCTCIGWGYWYLGYW